MHKHPCVVVLNFIKLFPITLINSYTHSSHHTCMTSIFFSEHFLTIKVIKKIISSHLDQWCTTTDWTKRESNSYFTITQLLLRCSLSFLKQIFFFLVNICWAHNSGKRIWFHQGENMTYYWLPLVIFVWEVLKGENGKSPTNVPSRLSTLRVLLISVLKIEILFVLANR